MCTCCSVALEAIGNLSGSLSCDDQVGDEEVRGLVCLAAQVAFEVRPPHTQVHVHTNVSIHVRLDTHTYSGTL